MNDLNLQQAPVNKEYRRCQVCFQRKTSSLGDVQHARLEKAKQGSHIQEFCPFADDVALYEAYVKEQQQKKRAKSKSERARRKIRQSMNNDT